MAAEIRATGLSEEQTTALLDEIAKRGFAGASTTSEGEGDDVRFTARVGIDGKTDVNSLSRWLEDQGIEHAIVQDGEVSA